MTIHWINFADDQPDHRQGVLYTSDGWLTFDVIRGWYDEVTHEVVQQGTGYRYTVGTGSKFIIVDDLDPG